MHKTAFALPRRPASFFFFFWRSESTWNETRQGLRSLRAALMGGDGREFCCHTVTGWKKAHHPHAQMISPRQNLLQPRTCLRRGHVTHNTSSHIKDINARSHVDVHGGGGVAKGQKVSGTFLKKLSPGILGIVQVGTFYRNLTGI